MNLFSTEDTLYMDDNVGKIFGNLRQLKIIGWCSRNSSKNKLYVLECSICKNDSELFGQGLFKMTMGNLNAGNHPCGCTKPHKWNEDQISVICKRKCEELGQEFVSLVPPYKGSHSKIKIKCQEHGVWDTTTISSLLSLSTGCRKCADKLLGLSRLKSNKEMVSEVEGWNLFPEGTTFKRSNRLDKDGNKTFISVYCPECCTNYETRKGTLKRGQRACECGAYAKKWTYLSVIKDGDVFLGIKFGITNNVKDRVITQNMSCLYCVELYGSWEYEDYNDCKNAERECKNTLPCGIFTKEEMRDGYTETTYIKYIDEVVKIYERNKGKRVF